MTSTKGTCHKGRGASVSGRWDRVTSGAVSDSTPRTKYTRGMRGQGQAWRLRERGQDRTEREKDLHFLSSSARMPCERQQ